VAKSTCRSWLTENEIVQIVVEYQDGSTIQEIASKHDRCYKTILKQLRKAGIDTKQSNERMVVTRIRQQQKRLDENEIQRLIAEYGTGLTVYQLAARFGCHRTTVSGCLKARGVKMRRRSLCEEQVIEAIHLYESGLSSAKVGERVGANAETVRQRLRERNVTIRDAHDRRSSHEEA
jgi:transposase